MWKIAVLIILFYFLGNAIIMRIAMSGENKKNLDEAIKSGTEETGVTEDVFEDAMFRLGYLFGIPVLIISFFRKSK